MMAKQRGDRRQTPAWIPPRSPFESPPLFLASLAWFLSLSSPPTLVRAMLESTWIYPSWLTSSMGTATPTTGLQAYIRH